MFSTLFGVTLLDFIIAMVWCIFGFSGTLVSAIILTLNLRIIFSIDFSVSLMFLIIVDIFGLVLLVIFSVRFRLLIIGSNSLMNFFSANLWVFLIFSLVRRRRFFISVFIRKMSLRLRVWVLVSWVSRFVIFLSRGFICLVEVFGLIVLIFSCWFMIIFFGVCFLGVFCFLLFMNFFAFFSYLFR